MKDNNKVEKTWAMFLHLSTFVAFLGVPFGNYLGPFVIWQVKKHDYPELEKHGKKCLNFQISLLIYFFAIALCFGIIALCLVGLRLLIAGNSNLIPGLFLIFYFQLDL